MSLITSCHIKPPRSTVLYERRSLYPFSVIWWKLSTKLELTAAPSVQGSDWSVLSTPSVHILCYLSNSSSLQSISLRAHKVLMFSTPSVFPVSPPEWLMNLQASQARGLFFILLLIKLHNFAQLFPISEVFK